MYIALAALMHRVLDVEGNIEGNANDRQTTERAWKRTKIK